MSESESKSLSPFQLRLRRFKRLKRGYYSFLLLAGTYLLSFFFSFLINNRALVVHYEGTTYFPAFRSYFYDTFGPVHELFGEEAARSAPLKWLEPIFSSNVLYGKEFDQDRQGEADYRALAEATEAHDGNWVLMPPIPYSPNESFLDPPPGAERSYPPYGPCGRHWLGTDIQGRDIFTRLAYGYRISISFALIVVCISYSVGILVGSILGYFGRAVDILGQRLVEIWSAIPFLYTVILVASIFGPKFFLLATLLSSFGWMSISAYIRGEFYREKAKDYVAAAIANGERHPTIMLRHILPNALTPVITFAPFALVGSIVSLVALDFLGFGLPVPTPSWGELLKQAKAANLSQWHLIVFPLLAMFITLQLIVFIGEAVREAFDPKVYSRLR